MRILLVKTSSMGDLIHTFPALTDAGRAIPGIEFDWLVEDIFAEIPEWHPLVKDIIPVALRRWRKNIFTAQTFREWRALRRILKQKHYDLIIDAQSLVKSAFLTYLGQGKRVGLDWTSARESLASLAYKKKLNVNFKQHAISRMRELFAKALGYEMVGDEPDFNLSIKHKPTEASPPYLVFLHGTTWESKLWPETYWQQLVEYANQAGYKIKMTGGNEDEHLRAQRIAHGKQNVDLMPRLSLSHMANLLSHAKAVVAVDTGFGHLAAALDVPTISIYGSTNPTYTGALGKRSLHLSAQFLCSPCLKRSCHYHSESVVTPACYATLPPSKVWQKVTEAMLVA